MMRGLRRARINAATQLFLRRVGNQVFTYKREPQRPRTEVRAPVALMGKRHNPAIYGPSGDDSSSTHFGRSRGARKPLRPVLNAVINPQDFYALLFHAIDSDIRQGRERKLPSSRPTRPRCGHSFRDWMAAYTLRIVGWR